MSNNIKNKGTGAGGAGGAECAEKFTKEKFILALIWALCPNKFEYNLTNTTSKNKLKDSNKKEKVLGNEIINKNDCKQWSTRLSENLIHDVLVHMGENPQRPEVKNSLKPDWETNDYIYEVKCRSWTTDGTAGEKVFGTMYKYSDVPELYNKPLRIICMGYQEYELTYGQTNIFGNVSEQKKKFLDLAKGLQIEYVKFSDFIKSIENISDYVNESTLNWISNVNKKESPKVKLSELNTSEE